MNGVDVAAACSIRQSWYIAIIRGININSELQIQGHEVGMTLAGCNTQRWSTVQGLRQLVGISSGQQQQPTHLEHTSTTNNSNCDQ